MICNFYQVLLGIKEGDMGGKCSTRNGDERFVSNFFWISEGVLGIGGRIMPTINWQKGELDSGGLGYEPMASSNLVTKLQAPKNGGVFLELKIIFCGCSSVSVWEEFSDSSTLWSTGSHIDAWYILNFINYTYIHTYIHTYIRIIS
jgi:hypothetical protein